MSKVFIPDAERFGLGVDTSANSNNSNEKNSKLDKTNENSSPLESSDDKRAERSSGSKISSSLSEKATGKIFEPKAERFGLGIKLNKETQIHLVDERKLQLEKVNFILENEKPSLTRPTERSSNWLGSDDLSQFLLDFSGGVGDFVRNYSEMRAKKLKMNRADLFYHCLANCEASQRGVGGLTAATTISIGREIVDFPKNVIAKGLSPSESLVDCLGDLRADFKGILGGTSGLRCSAVCKPRQQKGLK